MCMPCMVHSCLLSIAIQLRQVLTSTRGVGFSHTSASATPSYAPVCVAVVVRALTARAVQSWIMSYYFVALATSAAKVLNPDRCGRRSQRGSILRHSTAVHSLAGMTVPELMTCAPMLGLSSVAGGPPPSARGEPLSVAALSTTRSVHEVRPCAHTARVTHNSSFAESTS